MAKVTKLLKSFKFALKGVATIYKSEPNFRIQIVVALLVIILGAILKILVWQWIVIILLILFVLVLEMLNTVFELLVDMLKPRIHQYARDIKNIMASMVLITAVSAIIIGILIFTPYFF